MAFLKRDRYPVPKGHKVRTSPKSIQRAELTARALDLRREGYTNVEIAARLSVDGSSRLDENAVQQMIAGALKELVRPAAEEERIAELDRLDKLLNRATRIAMGNDRDRVNALNAALKAMERKAALLGLDAPKSIDIKDDRTHAPDQATIEAVVAQLAEEASKE